jgi:hypothetical protein
VVAIAGAPSYLAGDEVDAERVRSVARDGGVHPLATRNVNVFTVPSGDAASRAVDAVAPDAEGTTLREAVRQLDRAGEVPESDRDDELSDRGRAVRDAVAASMDDARRTLATELAARTRLDARQARTAVVEAFESYGSPTARARAVLDGRVVDGVVDAAADRVPESDARFRDATRTHVASALRQARASGDVQPGDDAVDNLRWYLDETAGSVAENATKEFVGGVRTATNASLLGLPLAPVPGHWYATTNVWVVDANATYPTFAVRARDGSAGAGGGSATGSATTYVRDGTAVSLDVDDDGAADRLGYADRVTARATVPVLVVVPPGRTGVGDRDLVMFEDSPGWPTPVPGRRPGATDATVANGTNANATPTNETSANATTTIRTAIEGDDVHATRVPIVEVICTRSGNAPVCSTSSVTTSTVSPSTTSARSTPRTSLPSSTQTGSMRSSTRPGSTATPSRASPTSAFPPPSPCRTPRASSPCGTASPTPTPWSRSRATTSCSG